MPGQLKGVDKQIHIDATPEVVFAYLTDLQRHGEWNGYPRLRVARISDGPIAAGSYCERERLETFQAPILTGGAASSQVSWVKSLTVTVCEPNSDLEFETKDIYNGLAVGSETVKFWLQPDGPNTALGIAVKRRAHVPGPLHVLMLAVETLRSIISRPIIGLFSGMFPSLRSNNQLLRIKKAIEESSISA